MLTSAHPLFLDESRLSMAELVGKGQYGWVFKAELHPPSGGGGGGVAAAAVKMLPQDAEPGPREQEDLLDEICFLANLDALGGDPNVVRMLGFR